MNLHAVILRIDELPRNREWLNEQSCPIIAYGVEAESIANDRVDVCADVVVPDLEAAKKLEQRIQAKPLAALTLVQVLRASEKLSDPQALDMESMAYATLQSGAEFTNWLRDHRRGNPAPAGARVKQEPIKSSQPENDAILLSRTGSCVEAVLNRAANRNAINVEMRDALVDMLHLLEADSSIVELEVRALGACFSIGGDLKEFGAASDSAAAHWIRTIQSPARLLAKHGSRITCTVHGACIGSGIELPAFCSRILAHRKTYFQLPELDLGLMPGAGGTVSITRRVGRLRTAWMVLSGKRVSAKAALEWGLVDEIVESASVGKL